MSIPERRARLLVAYGYLLLVTGVGVVLGGLTVRLTMRDASGWDAVFVLRGSRGDVRWGGRSGVGAAGVPLAGRGRG